MTLAEKGHIVPQSFKEHLARLPEISYSDSAFKGDFDKSPPQHTTRWISHFVNNGTNCHEYLSTVSNYEIGMLREWKKAYCQPWTKGEAIYKDRLYQLEETDLPASLHLGGMEFSLQGWLSIVHFLAMFGSVLAVGSPLLGSLFFGLGWTWEVFTEPKLAIMYAIPFAVLGLTHTLNKSGLPAKFSKPQKPVISFHRATGMVTINTKKSSESLPFREFQCCGMTVYTPNNGIKRLAFGLKHRHSPAWARLEGSMTAAYSRYPWPLNVRWELISHYMDVTRPLPDIPIFEPYRYLDPTTREWDEKNGRPECVWLNMSDDEYLELMSDSVDSAQKYPFDSPKDLNVSKHWAPAGNGKHWYQLG